MWAVHRATCLMPWVRGSNCSALNQRTTRALAPRVARRNVSLVGRSIDDLSSCKLEFDLITATDVIEHVAKPIEFVDALARNLRPGGRILVSTGNSRALAWRVSGASYYYSHLFEHIAFILPRWFKWAAEHGLPNDVLESEFEHRQADSPTGVRRWARFGLFGARLVASKLERAVQMRLPTITRRLGTRLIVGEPGLFRDHLMVSFGRSVTDARFVGPAPRTLD